MTKKNAIKFDTIKVNVFDEAYYETRWESHMPAIDQKCKDVIDRLEFCLDNDAKHFLDSMFPNGYNKTRKTVRGITTILYSDPNVKNLFLLIRMRFKYEFRGDISSWRGAVSNNQFYYMVSLPGVSKTVKYYFAVNDARIWEHKSYSSGAPINWINDTTKYTNPAYHIDIKNIINGVITIYADYCKNIQEFISARPNGLPPAPTLLP